MNKLQTLCQILMSLTHTHQKQLRTMKDHPNPAVPIWNKFNINTWLQGVHRPHWVAQPGQGHHQGVQAQPYGTAHYQLPL